MADNHVDKDSVLDTDEINTTQPSQEAAPEGGDDFAMPDEAKEIRLQGLFSSQQVDKVGTGTTTRKTVSKTFWYVEERDDGVVEMQPINVNNVPAGNKTEISKEDLIAKFNPEPEYYQEKVFPKIKELNASLKRAEEQRKQGSMYSAEFEYKQALDVDEDNVRANFGLGLTYMERGEPDKANDMFHRLVGLEAAFTPEHKHLFNEFGINLRKSNLFDQAIEYYAKAIETADYEDENLHYNIARAYFGKGEKDDCMEHLNKATQINPDFEEARKFLDYLTKKNAES